MPISKIIPAAVLRALSILVLLLVILWVQVIPVSAYVTTTISPDNPGDRIELFATPSGNNYLRVQADDGDSSYVASNNSDVYFVDLYNLDDLTLSGTVDSVSVTMVVRATNHSYQESAYTVIKTGGTEYNGTPQAITKFYQPYTTTYTTNPATGNAWTWAEINSLQAGVALRRAGNFRYTRCTQLRVSVDYTCSEMPSVTTGAATLVEETTATLHGVVEDDGGEACQYRFQYGTSPGVYSVNTTWAGSKTTGQSFEKDVSGLSEGSKYYFRAQVKNSSGTVSGSELSLLTKPLGPVAFTAVAEGANKVYLAWTKGTGAQRTMVRRKEGGYPADYNDGIQVYFDTGTAAEDTGLNPETAYFYRAWSEVTGSQQWSDSYVEATATTGSGSPPTPPPPNPTAVGGTVLPVNKMQVLAPWLAVFGLVLLAALRIVLWRWRGIPVRAGRRISGSRS